MGPISNLLGMLPGMGQMKEAISQVDDRDLDRTAAIIRSMTPAERDNPKMINGSRRLRIAHGSGVSVSEVNNLVDRFFEARKMMQQMGGAMGLPGASTEEHQVRERPQGQEGALRIGSRSHSTEDARRTSAGNRWYAGRPARWARPLGGVPPQLPPGTKMPDLSKLKLPKE